jgi:glycosyltransferase involved in cell wall biosynthesis
MPQSSDPSPASAASGSGVPASGVPPVLINGLPLCARLTGVGYYTLELFSVLGEERRAALGTASESNLHMFFGRTSSHHWTGEPAPGPAQGVAAGALTGLKAWLKKQLAPSHWLRARVRERQSQQFQAMVKAMQKAMQWKVLGTQKPILYHEPNFIAFPYEGPTVVTVHDFSFVRHPETHPAERVRFMNDHLPASLQQASRVVVVSEFVRDEMQALFGSGLAEKTVVVRNGVSARFLNGGLGSLQPLQPPSSNPPPPLQVGSPPGLPQAQQVLARHGLRHRGYLLSVGALEPRKNLISLLDAYARLKPSLKAQYPLVLVGPKGWHLRALEAKLQALRHEPIHWLGYVDEDALQALYTSARAFAYLSVYEGFGLPVLESMACGTPVLVSQAQALMELVDDAGLVVETHNITAITQALERRLLDDELWTDHQAKGLMLAQGLSWSKAAQAMEALYAKLV